MTEGNLQYIVLKVAAINIYYYIVLYYYVDLTKNVTLSRSVDILQLRMLCLTFLENYEWYEYLVRALNFCVTWHITATKSIYQIKWCVDICCGNCARLCRGPCWAGASLSRPTLSWSALSPKWWSHSHRWSIGKCPLLRLRKAEIMPKDPIWLFQPYQGRLEKILSFCQVKVARKVCRYLFFFRLKQRVE